jgi:hypothetical protein
MIKQLWHRYVLRHYVVFVPALVPDEVIREQVNEFTRWWLSRLTMTG